MFSIPVNQSTTQYIVPPSHFRIPQHFSSTHTTHITTTYILPPKSAPINYTPLIIMAVLIAFVVIILLLIGKR